ncbi:hypothetical protein Y079_22795, partial [Salmonella enterica subsp. enterica serovar Infantis str. CVM N31594]
LYRIPALAWALNALSLTSQVCKTCAMLFRSHGPHATQASDFYVTLKASYAGLFFRLNVSFIINK